MIKLAEEIRTKNYTREMEQSFYDYAMTTITNRALPDIRDGLKPVHRRILYGMSELKNYHNKPHKKSARIVGDILGKYHPHGDSSVYEAMVRLSQDFSLMIPVVDGHGNFGSIDGDGAAAMRYTEARLSLAGEKMASDLDKELVNFQSNYDDAEIEPVVLPARFPNLIINGSEGIATGMATNIPTHNPLEVAKAWEYMIKNEGKVDEDKLIRIIHAPDYPYGGIIVNEKEVLDFYRTGYGSVTMRGKHEIEDRKHGRKGIVFTELPRSAIGSKNRLVNQLIEAVNDKVLTEVVDVIDESSREGIRLVLEVKKGTDIERFLNKLWLKTKLQSSERMQFLVLIDGKPRTINIQEYFEEYIKFQKELHIRRNKYLLARVKERLEIVDGLLEAYDVMDSLIDAIRNAKTSKELLKCLTKGDTSGINWRLKKHRDIAKKYHFTKRQAEAILNRRLRTLTGLDIKQLTKEQKKLEKEKNHHIAIIEQPKVLRKELLKDVKQLREDYPIKRRSLVTTRVTDADVLEEKVAEKIGIVIDENNFIQARDSVSGTSLDLPLREDTNTNDTVAVFTSKGNLYQIKVTDIPVDKKVPIQVLSKMKVGEKVLKVLLGSQIANETFFVLTKNGRAKLTEGKELITKGYRSRTNFTKVDTRRKDKVIVCSVDSVDKWLVVRTNDGRGGRINLRDKDLPFKKYGKNAMGSFIVKMKKGEHLTKIAPARSTKVNVWGEEVKEYNNVTGVTVKPLK